jgi:hypothetical protein
MRSFLKNLALGVAVFALASAVVVADQSAKVKKTKVTFPTDVTVKGTSLKAGSYKLEFNEQSGELNIFKDNKVVATTTARWVKRDNKAKQTAITTEAQGNENELVSIAIGGEDQNLVIGAN